MAYVIVNYWPFLAVATAIGLLVGWWATGSGRDARTSAVAREDRIP